MDSSNHNKSQSPEGSSYLCNVQYTIGTLLVEGVSITRRLFLSLQREEAIAFRGVAQQLSQSPEGSSYLCNLLDAI